MVNEEYNLESVPDLSNVLGWVKRLEPGLLNSFVQYWSIRKSPSSIANKFIERLKTLDLRSWINLIESNHKFREAYGEETAKELIEIIEKVKSSG